MLRVACLSSLLIITSVLAGCGGSGSGRDALQRERDAMAEEAKAAKRQQQSGNPAATSPIAAVNTAASQPAYRVPAGTVVEVLLSRSLSSRTAGTGEEWPGKLAKDLKTADGHVVMPAGSEVVGRIVLASDGSGLRRKHELGLRLYRMRKSDKDPWVDVLSPPSIQEGSANAPVVPQAQHLLTFQL